MNCIILSLDQVYGALIVGRCRLLEGFTEAAFRYLDTTWNGE